MILQAASAIVEEAEAVAAVRAVAAADEAGADWERAAAVA